jgi:hypothetical protein
VTPQHGPGDWDLDDSSSPADAVQAGPARDPGELLAEIQHQLGIGVPRARYRPPDGPDVSGLAEGLGLR